MTGGMGRSISEDDKRSYKDRRDDWPSPYSESIVTVKVALIIGILCVVIGAGFVSLMNHEGRLSRMEACVESMKATSDLTQKIVMAIREDQVEFYRTQNTKWKSNFDMRGEIFNNHSGDKE